MKIKTHFDGEERFEELTWIAFIFSMKGELTLLVMISSWYAIWESGKKCIYLIFTSLSYKGWIFFPWYLTSTSGDFLTHRIWNILLLCAYALLSPMGDSPVHLILSLNRNQLACLQVGQICVTLGSAVPSLSVTGRKVRPPENMCN